MSLLSQRITINSIVPVVIQGHVSNSSNHDNCNVNRLQICPVCCSEVCKTPKGQSVRMHIWNSTKRMHHPHAKSRTSSPMTQEPNYNPRVSKSQEMRSSPQSSNVPPKIDKTQPKHLINSTDLCTHAKNWILAKP